MQSADDHSRSPSPSLQDFYPRLEDEDTTVTSKRFAHRKHKLDVLPPVPPMPAEEDLALLAVSAQMTEISYSISDIQTRIFEIQELRHRNLDDDVAAAKQDNGEGATNVIDQALINLDERLEAVSNSISAVDEALGITPGAESKSSADPLLLRKHAALIEEWDTVQTEAETLRDELKEDKWLAVFRTVSEQAEGMMASLEKGVTQCHDFIFQFQRRAGDDHQSSVSSGTAMHSDKSPVNYETFTTLLQSFEAKKKYYMPSITKVLSVLDKGVRDRVTKNGECLRRHADLRARWHNLKERIGRTDAEMESVRRQLVNRDLEPSEAGSTTSRFTSKSRNGFLGASMSTLTSRSPSSAASRTPSSATRSTSPFSFNSSVKRFANKVTDKFAGRTTPSALMTPPSSTGSVRIPSADSPTTRKSSFFPFRASSTLPPETPSRSHGHSQSVAASSTASGKPSKERWNASTKVEAEPAGTVKAPALRKRPSTGNIAATAGDGGSYFRSPSPANSAFGRSTPSGLGTLRAANASTSRLLNVTPSRPGSRSTSLSIWTKNTPTKSAPATPAEATPSRPPRATTPNGTIILRSHTPGGTKLPRARPTSPSHIPGPKNFSSAGSEVSDDDYEGFPTSMMQRAFSPHTPSRPSLGMRPTTPSQMRPRTPSNSLIPVPRLSLSSDSRSNTPDAGTTLRGKPVPTPLKIGRPSFSSAAPSSFREGSSVPSRPSSRATVFTPDQNPLPSYHPVQTDPLDVEVAKCVNGFPHSFIVERIDPALKAPPKNLEEIRAQYAIANALARKIITCRLVIISRSKSKGPSVSAIADGGEQRKVMCRVGGGWLDLQMYLLNRQAGMA